MPVIAAMRDAIVTLLNASSLTPTITAVAAYQSTANLQGLTGGRLLVIPREYVPELLTHDRQISRPVTIDVILQFKGALTTAVLDPWLAMAETISDTLLGVTLADGAVCTDVSWPHGVWKTEDMETESVLTIVIACKCESDG